ncbi:hypothetical protein [Wolbachia endosymbiont (group B) of Eucosma cana]|uniref:hypothetical protein n=1 Tax=Wolbachia endosymbiont (group B) of Eucosma cana TaxID=2954012 RepID=UPI0022276EBA|nr:hypothetical protein [Wolbachia endosymbiont (group B) of Eucosma cana]
MTHQLIFTLPKESYSIAIGPCSAKSRKCKEFIAKNEDVGMKFLISTKDDTGKTGKMSLCKDNNGQDEYNAPHKLDQKKMVDPSRKVKG